MGGRRVGRGREEWRRVGSGEKSGMGETAKAPAADGSNAAAAAVLDTGVGYPASPWHYLGRRAHSPRDAKTCGESRGESQRDLTRDKERDKN